MRNPEKNKWNTVQYEKRKRKIKNRKMKKLGKLICHPEQKTIKRGKKCRNEEHFTKKKDMRHKTNKRAEEKRPNTAEMRKRRTKLKY